MMIDVLIFLLLICLIITAISIFVFNDLLYIVIIFGAYSMIMSLIWQQLNSPDLAITEAAVGIGMTVLMVTVVTKVGRRPQ
jgi:energy-converting hydrogenase B subunit D